MPTRYVSFSFSCFAFCVHHLFPRIAIVFSLVSRVTTSPMSGPSASLISSSNTCGEGGRTHSLLCLSRLTIDHAPLSRRGTAPTYSPNRDTSNGWAPTTTFFQYMTYLVQDFANIIPFCVSGVKTRVDYKYGFCFLYFTLGSSPEAARKGGDVYALQQHIDAFDIGKKKRLTARASQEQLDKKNESYVRSR